MRLRPAFLFCGLLSLNLFAAGDSTQTKTNIAVSDLTGQGIDASTAAVISDRLRSELFNTGMVSVLERSQMQEILKEQGFQQTGCTSDQCAVETGQLLGLNTWLSDQLVLSGTLIRLQAGLLTCPRAKW
ncbi:MAG: CsgG/HfaB family protein [Chitinivibrionales bacterium]|nr:CsgG/HfaB family protein [Chitinivibrionales bacterium]